MAISPFSTVSDLHRALDGIAVIEGDGVAIEDATAFRAGLVDRLVDTAVFGTDEAKAAARWVLRRAAPALGAFPASIHDLYLAGGQGAYTNATAPAINV
ncbi:MAG: aldolase, partial [Chloroflexota bacterium]|nr:aldolase [Chloroflexota bacterium]